MKKDIKNKGFSLIELLVVVTLFGILGSITTQVFVIGLRSQAKSEVLKDVKQNGDYALRVMERMIRNSFDISQANCNTNVASITITNEDGFLTTFSCAGDKLSSESAGFPAPTPSFQEAITGTNVIVSGCNFRVVCPTPPINPKYVFINFTLSQAGSGVSPENRASIDYQTTVSLRGYE